MKPIPGPVLKQAQELAEREKSDAFRQHQLVGLKSCIAGGITVLNQGRYDTYDGSNVMQLADDVGRTGLERLKKSDK